MRITHLRFLTVTIPLLLCASPGIGELRFSDGGTHNIDYTVDEDILVDFESPGLWTTLNMLDGASVLSPYRIRGYADSTVTVSGGLIDRLHAYDNSQVTTSGGHINEIHTHDNSQVTASDGAIWHLIAFDDSQVTVSDGSMSLLFTVDDSRATVSGGVIETINASGRSQVDFLYGSIEGWLMADFEGILTIHGSDFAIDGTDVGYIEISSILGRRYHDDPDRQLTGTLLNGSRLDVPFNIGDNAKIILVPEPATLLLLTLGAFVLRKRRKA